MSRRSGLTVSALRFYDREGVLPAARVDPVTSYRRYEMSQVRQARLLSGMRRVSMPLAEMAAVIEAGSDAESVRDLLQAHVARLEDGLAQARTEVARLTALATDAGAAVVVECAELAAALSEVRYAVSDDPEHPALGGVLVEYADGEVRAVATDRYRLALASVRVHRGSAEAASSLLSLDGVDQVLELLPEEGRVELVLRPGSLTLVGTTRTDDVHALEADFPAYRQVIDADRAGAATDWAGARASADTGEEFVILESGHTVSGPFLVAALSQVGPGARLTVPEQLGPLVITDDQSGRLALVMPVLPDPV